MDSESDDKEQKTGGQSGGFQFNAPNTANQQMFIDARNASNLNFTQGLAAEDLKELDKLFQPLKEQVQAAPPDKRPQAETQVQELHAELAKGSQANTERLTTIIDGLVALVPGALSAVVSMFASPVLAGLVGPATKFILDRIKK